MNAPARQSVGASVLLVALLSTSCTNAQLEPVPKPPKPRADNKLAVEGRFCTTNPDDLAFPVKLLFLMDISSSMDATDPGLTRVDALIDVIDAVSGTDGVEIDIVTMGPGTASLTSGFVTPEEALPLVVGTGQAAGVTDFVGALDKVITELVNDMSTDDPLALQNARYAILFLSDGIPDSDGTFDPVGVCEDAAEWERARRALEDRGIVSEVGQRIDQIHELARQYDVRELTFNTAFASSPQVATDVKKCGGTFMRAMSLQGSDGDLAGNARRQPAGQFRDFSSGEAINFLFVDFTSFKRVFAMKSFLALNINAAPFSQALGISVDVASDDPTLALGIIDSDGDGLTDQREDRIGSDAQQTDTDRDGFSDLLEDRLTLSGSDPLDPTDADCAADVDRGDGDGDGLRDCEERFFGTNIRAYDTDLDGFGDGVEVHYGLNPGLNDTLVDVDFDGVRNNNELRAHSRVDQDDVVVLSEHAYRYKVREEGLSASSLCYSFSVENIALASTQGARPSTPDEDGTLPAAGLGGGEARPGDNLVLFEVTEQPFDDPGEAGVARLACVRARFDADAGLKEPANGRVTLPDDAFRPVDGFDPLVDCVEP